MVINIFRFAIFLCSIIMEKSITINSIEELPVAAKWLDEAIANSRCTVIALYGAMGAGKTTLIGEYSRQKGVTEGISSPTFAIVNQYETEENTKIFHFDCYRFESEREAMDIGVFDYFDSGNICFVEWPERIEGILSECDVLGVKIEALSPTSRQLSLL